MMITNVSVHDRIGETLAWLQRPRFDGYKRYVVCMSCTCFAGRDLYDLNDLQMFAGWYMNDLHDLSRIYQEGPACCSSHEAPHIHIVAAEEDLDVNDQNSHGSSCRQCGCGGEMRALRTPAIHFASTRRKKGR